MANNINIALTFDDAYWAPAYATIRSVALASLRRSDLVFHLVHHRLSAEHRAAIDQITDEFPVRVVHHDTAADRDYETFMAGLAIGFNFPRMIYARLMLGTLPVDTERLIYLDCDLMVRAPIEELAELDLGGRAVAAVLEPHRHRAMLGRDFRQNADLFDFSFGYFNAGMLAIDRSKYAAAKLPELAVKLNENGRLAQLQYDQAVLNIGLKDNWLPLDFRWNVISPQLAHENFEPKILHYTGRKKPWLLLSRAAFAQAYRHTMTNDVFYRYWRERQVRRLKRLVGLRR